MTAALRCLLGHYLGRGSARRGFYSRRVSGVLFITICLVVMMAILPHFTRPGSSSDHLQRALLGILAVVMIASGLSGRSFVLALREEATRLLALSELGPAGTLIWILLLRSIQVMLQVLAAIPLLLYLGTFGHLQWSTILLSLLIFAVTMTFAHLCMLIAAVSVQHPEGADLLGGCLLFGSWLLGATPGLFIFVYSGVYPERMMIIGCPLVTVFSVLFGRGTVVDYLCSAGLWALLCVPALLLAIKLYGWRLTIFERVTIKERLKRLINRAMRPRSLIPIVGNPCRWMEFHIRRHGWYSAMCILFAISLMVAAFLLIMNMPGSGDPEIAAIPWIAMALLAAISIMSSLTDIFSHEWKAQTLENLMLTTLTDREILVGKLQGILLTRLPWFVVLLLVMMRGLIGVEGLLELLVACLAALLAISTMVAIAIALVYHSLCQEVNRLVRPRVIFLILVAVWLALFLYFITKEMVALANLTVMAGGAGLVLLAHIVAWRRWRILTTRLREEVATLSELRQKAEQSEQ